MTSTYNCNFRILILVLSFLFFSITTVAQPPIQWQKCLGGSNDDNSRCIRQTKDGGFISVGSTISDNGDVTHNNGFVDYWVVKQYPDGSIQWQKPFGGSSSDVAYSIEHTTEQACFLLDLKCLLEDALARSTYYRYRARFEPCPTTLSD
jgi:hypothetical protein